MTRKNIFITIITLALVVGFIWIYVVYTSADDSKDNRTLFVPNISYVELADEPQEHSQGLMNREDLCPDCAMLFVFNQSAIRSFWMKNTLIPLDIIFIDSDYQVVKIHADTTPLQTRPSYSSGQPIKYVLETNANFASQNNIQEGDYLAIDYLIDISLPHQNFN